MSEAVANEMLRNRGRRWAPAGLARVGPPLGQQPLDPSRALAWHGSASAPLRCPAVGDRAWLEALPSCGCTPLHLALAARCWGVALQILDDPVSIARPWLALFAQGVAAAADRRDEHPSRDDHGLRQACEELLCAWALCCQDRALTFSDALTISANPDDPALAFRDDLGSAFASTGARLTDVDFTYSSFTALHVAVANAAPLSVLNRLLRVGGSNSARARCSVSPLFASHHTGRRSEALGAELQAVHVAIKADQSDEAVQLLLQAKGSSLAEWQIACVCEVWGQRRRYSPLELAKHHQNRRLQTLLEGFERDGAAACEAAALTTALQRLLIYVISEEFELDYDTVELLADALPPAPLDTLLRFVRQGFAWFGDAVQHSEQALAEMRLRLAEQCPIQAGSSCTFTAGGRTIRARVQRVDPGPPSRVRLEWTAEGKARSGWRLLRDVEKRGYQLGDAAQAGCEVVRTVAGAPLVRASDLFRELGLRSVQLWPEEEEAIRTHAGDGDDGVLLNFDRVCSLFSGTPEPEPEPEPEPVPVPVSVARATERALLDEATAGLATTLAEESATDEALAAVSAELAALEGAAPPAPQRVKTWAEWQAAADAGTPVELKVHRKDSPAAWGWVLRVRQDPGGPTHVRVDFSASGGAASVWLPKGRLSTMD